MLNQCCEQDKTILEKDKTILEKVKQCAASFIHTEYNHEDSVLKMIEELQWEPIEVCTRRHLIAIYDESHKINPLYKNIQV